MVAPRKTTLSFELLLAGIWDRWDRGQTPEETFAIITTSANELLEPYHDRMPVILPEETIDCWLDPGITDPAAILSLLKPYPAAQMTDTIARAFLALQAKAQARHVPVEALLQELTARLDRPANENDPPFDSSEAWLQELDRLAEDSAHVPCLPADFSRADFYDGRPA